MFDEYSMEYHCLILFLIDRSIVKTQLIKYNHTIIQLKYKICNNGHRYNKI